MMRLVLAAALVACSNASPAPTPHHEDRQEPALAAPALALQVRVDGVATTWRQELFDRVPHFASANHGGDERDTWSLRELATTAVGPGARVVAVIGDHRQVVDAVAWVDATRTPIVHRTRRGWLKFRWADEHGKWGEPVVKDVSALEIAR
jgi:hypothetical protein